MKRFLYWLKIIISLSLLVFLFLKVEWRLVFPIFEEINFFWLLISLCMIFVSLYFSSLRWKHLLKPIGFEKDVLYLFRLNLTSFFYSSVLPGGQLTGELYKCLKIGQGEEKKGSIMYTVLFDKFIGLIALFVVGFFGVVFTEKVFQEKEIVILTLSLLLFFSVAFLLFMIWEKSSDLVKIFRNLIFRDRNIKMFTKLHNIFFIYKNSYKPIFFALFLGIIFQVINSISIFLMAISINMDIDLLSIFWIVSFVSLILLIPISVMGLGLREGSFVIFLGMIGITDAKSLSLSLLVSLMLIVIASFGGVMELINKRVE